MVERRHGKTRGELLGVPALRYGRKLRGNEAMGRTGRVRERADAIPSRSGDPAEQAEPGRSRKALVNEPVRSEGSHACADRRRRAEDAGRAGARAPPGKEEAETVNRRTTIAMVIAGALASGGASATKTAGEAMGEAYEQRAESEHRKSWCRWLWIRENMLARTLAGALLEPCASPPQEEMRRWKAERDDRQQRAEP